MSRPTALATWFDDAQHALSTEPVLTVDTVWALVSQPDDGGVPPDGVTWWLEEARRLMLDRARDRMPLGLGMPAYREWQARADRLDRRVEALLATHAEAMQRAAREPSLPVATTPDVPRTATERAMRARRQGQRP